MARREAPDYELSGLDHDDDVDSLSLAEHDYLADPGRSPPAGGPGLTRLNGLALVISLQIGSGIFTAPSQVSQHVAAPGYGLLVWLLGGLLVWAGAASFVELGLRVPTNGGVQEYLRAALGGPAAFLFAWAYVAVAKPAANAVIAAIFADYLRRALTDRAAAPWALKAVAVACVAAVTFVNCLGAAAGARAANLFLVLKVAALASVAALGGLVWVFGYGEGVPAAEAGWFGVPLDEPEVGAWPWIGNFVTALFGALFCYSGWETIGFVTGDMANPEADLPVVIHGAMVTVIAGFTLMNAALYVCLPLHAMRASSTVAVEFAVRTLGPWGGLIFSLVVAVSAMGALNANVFATAKLVVSASQRNYFPSILANLHCSSAKEETEYLERKLEQWPSLVAWPLRALVASTREPRWQRAVPIFPLMLNGLIASFYITMGTFNDLVTFIGVVEYSFLLLSVIGLLLLRREDRPGSATTRYRTWIGNPVIFSIVSSLLVARGVISQPLQGLAIVIVVALGLLVYYIRFGSHGFTRPPGVV